MQSSIVLFAVGIGAGLRYFKAGVKLKGSDLNGEFEYYGPAVFIAGSF
jgi:hypothetical protein